MIPKIIHLCWLSGDSFPDDILNCLSSWSVHLNEYEIWLWGKLPECVIQNNFRLTENGPKVVEKKFDLNSVLWTKQAFKNRKYAFAADYIRLYALYNYGGIYLDADVIVYKSFNPLLNLPYLVGADKIGSFEAAVIGCEKGCTWIKDIFTHYNSFDMLSLPVIFKDELVNKKYSFILIHNATFYQSINKTLYVYDSNFFNSRDHIRIKKTNKSFCAHNYLGSWVKDKKSLITRIKLLSPSWIMNIFFYISHSTWNKHKYDNIKIPFK